MPAKEEKSHGHDQTRHHPKRLRQAGTFQEGLLQNRGIRLRDHERAALQGGYGQDIGFWQFRREKQECPKGAKSPDGK